MLRKFAGCLLVFGVFVAPLKVWALGLGDIRLDSALNQPLRAEIELVSATPEEVSELTVGLASADAFASYGLDRPSYLFDLRFNLERRGGSFFVNVTSVQPMKEPFVVMLVEAVWPRGRLLREYTVFLDPPVFVESTEPPAPVASPSAGSQSSDRSGSFQRQTTPSTTTAPATTTQTAPSSGASVDQYRVQRGDSLWAIADRFRPTDVTVNQMMIALYRNNPNAFDGNINYLRSGATLGIPNRGDALYYGDQEANSQVSEQNRQWRASRGQAVAQQEPAARLELVPPEEGVTQTGSSDAGADTQQVSELEARVAELEQQLADAQQENERLINLQSDQLAGLQDTLGETEETTPSQPEETQEPVAEVDTGEEVSETEEPVAGLVETPETTTDVAEPAEEAETTTPPPVISTPEPSLVDKAIDFVKGFWLYLLMGVVALGLVLVFMLRRGSDDADESWDTGEWDEQSTLAPEEYEPTESQPPPSFDGDEAIVVVEGEKGEEIADPTQEFAVDERLFEDTGTFTPGELEIEKAEQAKADAGETAEYPFEDTMIGHDALQLDESDPVAEADFHMAYGLYDQAADLVSAAADKAPERQDLKMKLLEIFFVWGNKEKFLESAKELKESLGPGAGGEWDKVVIMGKQLCPEEALFAGDFSAGEVDLALEGGDAGEVDLLTGEEGGTDMIELDLDEALSAGPVVGGDADTDAETREASVDELREDMDGLVKETTLNLGDAGLDLDLGLDQANEEVPAVQETDQVEQPLQDLGEASDVVDIDFELKAEDTRETAVLEEPNVGSSDETVLADLEGLDELREAVDGGEDATARLGDLGLGADDDATVAAPRVEVEATAGTVETLTLHSQPDELADDDFSGDDQATVQTPQLTAADATVEAQTLTLGDDTVEASGLADFDVFASDQTAELQGMDLSQDAPSSDSTADFDVFADGDAETMETNVDFSLDDEATTEAEMPVDLGDPTEQMPAANDELDEVGTKLDLARAFMDMGDSDGARSILEEVLDEGNSNQQQEAKNLLDSLA
ncbi:MAG: FimV/HubP family polar landmark protein [Pseudomonadota bacterium]